MFVGEQDHFHINLTDEVVRGSIILEKGKLLWPPPAPVGPPATPPVDKSPAIVGKVEKEVSPFMTTFKDAIFCSTG